VSIAVNLTDYGLGQIGGNHAPNGALSGLPGVFEVQ
jgi:hypothetical protein